MNGNRGKKLGRSIVACGLGCAIAASLGGCGWKVDLPGEVPPVSLDAVPVSYGFGRRFQEPMAISPEEWRVIESIMGVTPDAASERSRIPVAITEFELLAGAKIGTDQDLNMNEVQSGRQLDCVDECTNTSTYLRLMIERGLIRHHTLQHPAYRGLLLASHNTAVLRDKETHVDWVVDSWFGVNGTPPRVQPVTDWRKLVPVEESVAAKGIDSTDE